MKISKEELKDALLEYITGNGVDVRDICLLIHSDMKLDCDHYYKYRDHDTAILVAIAFTVKTDSHVPLGELWFMRYSDITFWQQRHIGIMPTRDNETNINTPTGI